MVNGGFCIISNAKWHETKGSRIEPSPCNVGIMVRLLRLSAVRVWCWEDMHADEKKKKKKEPLPHSFTLASFQGPCCSGTPSMPVENGGLLQTHRGKNKDGVDKALSGSSCQSPAKQTIRSPLFSAAWFALTLSLCACHYCFLAAKPLLKQTVT